MEIHNQQGRPPIFHDVIFQKSPLPFSRFAGPIALRFRSDSSHGYRAADAASTAPAPRPAPPRSAASPEGDVLAARSLFQLYFGVKTAPGSGPNGAIRTVTTDTFKLRADTRVDLTPDGDSRAGRSAVSRQDPLNSSNPNGDTLYGLGDTDVQAALIHDIDARWKAGFGARLIMPTGDDNLGSGKWQIMPIVGARYSMPDVGYRMYVEPLLRYDVSFAGDPTRKSISNLQFAPEVNFSFPDGSFFTLSRRPTFAGISVRLSLVRRGVSFCPSTPASGANSPKR